MMPPCFVDMGKGMVLNMIVLASSMQTCKSISVSPEDEIPTKVASKSSTMDHGGRFVPKSLGVSPLLLLCAECLDSTPKTLSLFTMTIVSVTWPKRFTSTSLTATM